MPSARICGIRPRVILQRPISAVIFDLDGTLLDTEPLYSQATEAVVGRFGKEYSFDLKARSMGRDAVYGATLLIEALELPLSVAEYLAERRQHLLSLFEATPVISGAVDLVRRLSRARVPLAIATSSSQELCDLKLHGKSWLDHFDAIVYGDDPRVRKLKPDPDVFLLAAADLKVPAEDCLVFEDSPAGVQAALAARMQVIALPDPRHDRLDFAGATRLIEGYDRISLSDLGL